MLERRASLEADPVNPREGVLRAQRRACPTAAILTADSGSATNWWARHLRLRRGMRGALSGTLATMGPAIPYALAAKFAFPDRPVIAVEGDGAMQMNGINALIDVAKYRDRWVDPRFVVLVLNNRDLNQVTWEQRVLAGDPKLESSQVVPDFPYARYAELLGFRGIRVDAPDQVGAAWDEALARRPPGRRSRRSPTPRCRRSHRTSRATRPSSSPRRCSAATPAPAKSSASRSRARPRSCSTAERSAYRSLTCTKTSAPAPVASPDPDDRAYRIDVLLDGIPEETGVAVMQRIGDLLVEAGLATPEGGNVRAVIGMHEHTWSPNLADAIHVVIPRAIPQSPDLGLGYSPN